MNRKLTHPFFGLDATGEVPPVAQRAVDSSFIVRYVSRYSAKVPTKAEVEAYRSGNIHLAVVFEDGAENSKYGHGQGVADAEFARNLAHELGMPANRPIYFAVDFDTAGNPAVTDPYFDGVALVMGKGMSGPYGGIEVCTHQLNRGFLFAWQTIAWSRGFFESRCQLYQFGINHTVGGVGVDYNHAYYEDFGQWDYKFAPPPPPDPKHYNWYIDGSFIDGDKKINERRTVQNWDEAWSKKEEKVLTSLLPSLTFLSQRIYFLATEGLDLGEFNMAPNWSYSHRKWRLDQIMDRIEKYHRTYSAKKN